MGSRRSFLTSESIVRQKPVIIGKARVLFAGAQRERPVLIFCLPYGSRLNFDCPEGRLTVGLYPPPWAA